MLKLLCIDAAAILLLVLGRLYVSGPIVLDREGAFFLKLQNSLYYLDQAKSEWATVEHKADEDIPTMQELIPYLGEHQRSIDELASHGVVYTITPRDEDHAQSDYATLTQDIRFRSGFSRYYPAGKKFSLQGVNAHPTGSPCYVFFQQNWQIMVSLWVIAFLVGNAIYLVSLFRGRASSTTGVRREGGVEPPQPDL